jgi:nucleoside-diphosphate-sugar epimerase
MKKKLLITGSDGFVGAHLRRSLNDYEAVTFDVTDGNVVTHNFDDAEVSHVFHLAALTSAPESWEKPFDYYYVNMMGTVNILEYCRKTGASMTYVNTYPYGMPLYNPIDEQHPCAPNTAYNHSKHLSEDICRFYAENFNVSVTVLRLFNVYGEGQSPKFLIPHIIKQALFNHQIEVMDLEPKRDYVYIGDVIDALKLTIGRKGFNIYNIGSGESKSVKDVCDCVLSILNANKKIVSAEKKRKNEVTDIQADIKKIKHDLGWSPKTSFAAALEKTIRYYQQEG